MTDTIKSELLGLSAERANLTPDEVLNVLLRPEWDKAGRMYDWRNHVNRDVKRLWPELSTDSRLVAFYTAVHAAYDEEGWDSVWLA
jgi:hypothetical protein